MIREHQCAIQPVKQATMIIFEGKVVNVSNYFHATAADTLKSTTNII